MSRKDVLKYFTSLFCAEDRIFITIIKKHIERIFNGNQFWRFSSSLLFLANDKQMVLPSSIVLL